MKDVILIVVSILILSSCQDYLDIEPQQAISTSVALSDEQGVRKALVGVYDMLSQLPSATSGDMIVNSDLLANTDDLVWTNFVIPLTQLLEKNIAAGNNAIENYWAFSYQTINQANTVLDALETINPEDRDAIAAELRFIRAWVYFDLVNMFAKPWTTGNQSANLGVPLVLTPAEKSLENPEVPRNSVAEIYDHIIDDLSFAKTHLLSTNGAFANTYAASGLLSRVYLMQENFQLALLEADRIISSDEYQLLPNFVQVFNQPNNSEEDIFSIQVTSQDGQNRMSILYSGELEGGAGFIGITEDHISKYEQGDERAVLFYHDQQSGTIRTGKWRVIDTNDGNVTAMRLAEMYLTRAECRLRIGDHDAALMDVNTIRNRAGLPSLQSLDLEAVLQERYLELVFEGHQFRDAKRNRKMIGGRPFDDPRLIYPIPQRELDVNRSLVQNEGF